MLQLTYTKGQWTGTVPDAPEDWLATIATLPAGMQYLIDYGWKQSHADSYVGADDETMMRAKLLARHDAIIAGTVRVGSGKPKLPPIEREIIRLAGEAVDAAAEAKRAKLKKEVRAAYVEKYVERFREDLTAKATENLAKRAELQEASGSILDELFAEPEPEPAEPRRKR
jgi:hypothetical protein